ncbi:hypothetical protein [Demequina soli]|uniref:hypothetical protein n=1 Tax=Demequina soli TaxID=1638987 RepID=UPI000B071A73|nr:hypothetical protein [Demequina soli]
MRKVVEVIAPLAVGAALVLGVAAPASAYAGAEQGTKYCTEDSPVATKIRADGTHSHTQRNYTSVFSDYGYVHYSYKGWGFASASYYLTGGIGYFSYTDSSAYCAAD